MEVEASLARESASARLQDIEKRMDVDLRMRAPKVC